MMTKEEEVWCDVSDDEMYNPGKEKKGTWEPKAEDILKVFKQLQSKKVLDLHWKCPGRRPPESDVKEEEETKEEHLTTPLKQEEKKPTIPNEFDFDEEDFGGTKTVLTPRRTPGSAPKSQKKEAKMDKILKDMMHQRKLQAAEREARKLSGNKSPRTPASPGRARIGSPAGSPRTPNRQSPVRIGAGPNDSITTTPVRAPIESQSAMRVTKAESSNVTSDGNQKTYDANFISSKKAQVSQTASTVSNVLGHQLQTSYVGEATSKVVQREVTSSPQSVHHVQQNKAETGKTHESNVDSTDVKSDLKDSTVEKMDTT